MKLFVMGLRERNEKSELHVCANDYRKAFGS